VRAADHGPTGSPQPFLQLPCLRSSIRVFSLSKYIYTQHSDFFAIHQFAIPTLLIADLAMLQHLLVFPSLTPLLAICFTALTARLLYNRYGTGLTHIPGPFWASFTDLYRLYIVWGRRPEQWHIQLYRQYGDWVRIGPTTILCSDNVAAKKIYALNAGYVKVRRGLVSHTRSLIISPPVSLLSSSTSARQRRAAHHTVHDSR
jgi:hypothetical protein